MKTETITVTSLGSGMNAALDMTENLGVSDGLDKKEVLHLRLLSEEMFGMLRSITGEVSADYWIEQEDRTYELYLLSFVEMTQDLRKNLLAVSTTGTNAAAKGFMGKLRDVIATALLPTEDLPNMLTLALMSMGSPNSYRAESGLVWTLAQYKKNLAEAENAAEARDELERSIVASIADDVSISIAGNRVEMKITKTF